MDIEKYIEELDRNEAETLALARSCPVEKLGEGTAENWSILQVLEHICIAEKLIGMVLLRPFDTRAESNEMLGAEKLQRIVAEGGSGKIKANESLHPKGEIKSITDFENTFLQQRSNLKKALRSGDIIVDNRSRKHPALGEMTISDWLHFMRYHTERHLKQIRGLI